MQASATVVPGWTTSELEREVPEHKALLLALLATATAHRSTARKTEGGGGEERKGVAHIAVLPHSRRLDARFIRALQPQPSFHFLLAPLPPSLPPSSFSMSLSEKVTQAPAGDGSKKPAAAAAAPSTEDTNLDLLEEDDEFEEFPAESQTTQARATIGRRRQHRSQSSNEH